MRFSIASFITLSLLIAAGTQSCATPCANVNVGADQKACLVTWYEREYPEKYQAILKKHGVTEGSEFSESASRSPASAGVDRWDSVRNDVIQAARDEIQERRQAELRPMPVPAAAIGF